ncbi:MAG: response regulator [Pseudomonadota bacterium]
MTKFHILIVEDDAFIALGLATAVEDIGGVVLGPVATVAEALAVLEKSEVHKAILDAQLADRDVTPVAVKLLEQVIPFVVHTGTGLPAELARVHPELPLVMKPASPETVVKVLLNSSI